MVPEDQSLKPPTCKTSGDYVHSTVKILANLAPSIGGALAELFASVFAAPLDRRRQEWLENLGAVLEDVCRRVDGLTPEKLSQNDEFISVCQHASTIALRSHQKEKLEALRAALKNVVLREEVGPIKSSIFIRLVDEFTVLHLRVLDMYHRAEWYRKELQKKHPRVLVDYPSIGSLWDDLHFEPRSGDPLLRLAERDIVARGLAHTEAMQRRPQGDSFLSPLGKEFLAFISEPPGADG